MVSSLKDVLSLDFISRPVLSKISLINLVYWDAERNCLLNAVKKMLKKEAIEPFQNISSLGYYSCLFLAPKKTGGWRPVIDLSGLNTYLHITSFERKTAKIIQESLDQGQWMTPIDLPDAYFNIPMALWTHKHLRCMVLGEVY